MAATALSHPAIALRGAPDSDIGSKDAKNTPIQAMQLGMSQQVVDELLESLKNGKTPQIIFGRIPQIKYGDKTQLLQGSSESFRYELYQSSGTGSDNDFTFTGLINHSLAVQKAEEVTSGVDSALEQLRSSMAAISELKEANKTIVGDGNPSSSAGHRRFNSKSLKPQPFRTSSNVNSPSVNSPLRSNTGSPAITAVPIHGEVGLGIMSKSGDDHTDMMQALRVAIVSMLAFGPKSEGFVQNASRLKDPQLVREILPKIAKKGADESWTLMDKMFKEVKPFEFKYNNPAVRQKAIDAAVKAFDRLRLPKDDKLWQNLLPKEERGKGKCLSLLNIQAPAQNPGTPKPQLGKMPEKKKAPQKNEAKEGEKEAKKQKEVKEKKERPAAKAKEKPEKPDPKPRQKPQASRETAPKAGKGEASKTVGPSAKEAPKARKETAGASAAARAKPKATKEPPKERRPTKPVSTKPKNPSPLSASQSAGDFEDNHAVHKTLSAAPSSQSSASGNSDGSLKRKANDLDRNIHDHNVAKKPRKEPANANLTPMGSNRLTNGTPSSGVSVKRKAADDSSATDTPPAAKVRKTAALDTSAASRYQNHAASPGNSSSATTSPTVPAMTWRQTIHMSQMFEKCYKKYTAMYTKLAESPTPPTDAQRDELMEMHNKLADMKRDIRAGAAGKY